MDNIDKLLQSLDSPITANNEENNTEYLLELLDSETTETGEKDSDLNSSLSNLLKCQNAKNSKSQTDPNVKDDFNFEDTKNQLSVKYSDSGYEIHKKLKENRSKNYFDSKQTTSSWNSKTPKEKSDVLSAVSRTLVKSDVYAEPIFGLRLINPVVSSSFIQSKMTGKQPIAVSNISYHLRCGDKNADWVFAGAVVFKSGLKTSQKGSQYCLWKVSDLKCDLKQATVYLFSKACTDLWKVSLGTVVAILNAVPFYKEEKVSSEDVTLTVKSVDQVMIWGSSRDYGICKAKKKNGDNCTSFVNKSQCEFCVYHVKSEYNKFAGKRSNLQSATSSPRFNDLRNKILGKNEVFYGGKSYTAIKPTTRNNKIEQRNNLLLNQLSVNPAKKNSSMKELDRQRLEMLTNPSSSQNPSVYSSNFERDHKKNTESLTKSHNQNSILNDNSKQNLEYAKTELQESNQLNYNTNSDFKVESKANNPVSGRLHLLKRAGERMLETGEPTRISWDKPKKKNGYISFAEVFSPDVSPVVSSKPTISKPNNPEINTQKKVTIDKSQKTIDFSIDIRPSKSINSFKGLINTEPSLSPKQNNIEINEENKLKMNQKINSFTSSEKNQLNDDKCKLNMMMRLNSVSGNSIREKKKALAKMNAINIIKKKGGLIKVNPNQVRLDPQKRKSLKRAAESNDDEEVEGSVEKSVLSKRFIDLMNASSKHENLVQIAEDIEQQNYFNKMEKKEQLEEKMLSTYKIPCKAVMCLKCKYKWFSASDLCRAEGHPIKIFDTVKRYFKCENCSNRTVSLEIIPLVSCKQCGNSKWTRAPMIKEKLAKCDTGLNIRGDEIKFLDSLSHSMNINLLVPLDT